MSRYIIEEVMEGRSVFKDRAKLSIEYVPSKLPHREEEYRLLTHWFRPVLENPRFQSLRVVIRGKIGSGKTVLSRRFGMDVEAYAQEQKVKLLYTYVNCRLEGSFFNVIKFVIRDKLKKTFPGRGYSAEEALHVLMEILDDEDLYLILALDELESIIRREGSDPIYAFTRIQEERDKLAPRLSLISIFREPDCEDLLESLDKSTLGTLQKNIIRLDGYSTKQLEDILSDRAEEAFYPSSLDHETISLIADIVGARGDARYAIELLERAGVYADTDLSTQVLPEHARKAAATVYPGVELETLDRLDTHQKLLLLAIARRLKHSKAAYTTTGEVEEFYRLACEEYSKEPRGHTQLWKYLNDLSYDGLILAKISGEGVRGKTTLIGLPGIPAEALEHEIQKAMKAA